MFCTIRSLEQVYFLCEYYFRHQLHSSVRHLCGYLTQLMQEVSCQKLPQFNDGAAARSVLG